MKKSTSLLLFIFPFLLVGQSKINDLDSVFKTHENYFQQKLYKEIVTSNFTKNKLTPASTNDSLLVSKILHVKANALYEVQKYNEAIITSDKAIRFLNQQEDNLNLKGIILFDKAFSEYALERYKTSYNTVKQAEKLLSSLKEPDYDYLVSIYADLSSTATYYGFFDEAEFYLKKGLKIYQQNSDKLQNLASNQASKEVVVNHNLIYLYSRKGDEKKMLSSLKGFEKLKQKNKFNVTEKRFYAISLNNVGDFYLNFKDSLKEHSPIQKGKTYLLKALKNLDHKKFPDNLIQIKFNLVKQLRYNKEFERALIENKNLMELAGSSDFRIPFFHAQRSLIFAESGQKEKAINELNYVANLIHNGKEKLKKDGTNFSPSTDLNHTGLLVETPITFLELFPNDSLIKKQASLFFRMGLQQFKNCYEGKEFSNKLKNYYNSIISGLLQTQKLGYGSLNYSQILNEIENIENKLAWKEFLDNRNYARKSIPDSIIKKEFALRTALIKARMKNESSEIQLINEQIKKHRSFLEDNYPKISKSLSASFSIEGFQKKLQPDEVVIRYKRVKNDLCIFKITSSALETIHVNFDKTLEANIKNYISTIKDLQSDVDSATKLAETLLPFDPKTYGKIIVIPDDILYYLPFETLVLPNGNYLINDTEISYASDLIFIKSNSLNTEKNKENFLQVYTPEYTEVKKLSATKEEIENITKFFDYKLFNGEKSSKKNFIENTPDASMIHLAMHANINNETPQVSHFDFNNESLYLEELYALKLDADLAVLSACNTGNGNISKTYKGPISLQRAFTFAGVGSTVSSLWKVPDKETSKIMTSFYTYLKKGKSKSKALQLAKKEYLNTIEDDNLKHPFYWAGFVINGNVSPVTNEQNPYTIFLIGFVILVGILFIIKKIKS
jgi:CHAT domain-containing protein